MLTQAQLAESLNIRRVTVAQTEKRSDLLLSTLRNYIEAMGGRLLVTVEFPDPPSVMFKGFSDTELFSIEDDGVIQAFEKTMAFGCKKRISTHRNRVSI